MKKFIFLFVPLLSILIFWSCEQEVLDPGFDTKSSVHKEQMKFHKSKLQNRVLLSEALTDNVIGNTNVRKMQIYTPPGYDRQGDERYPVVYLLHGLPFSEKAFTDISTWDEWVDPDGIFKEYPDFPEEGFRLWVDGLIESGAIEPMIIVMPNAASEAGYGFSFYTNSILNGNFEDFIVNDVVNYMDENYNTIKNADGRAVIGYSQGGYAAFKFGMKHPDVFGALASHSGLLMVDAMFTMGSVLEMENPDGFTGPDPAKFMTSALYAMSAAWSPNLLNPPFYVDLPFEFDSEGHVHLVPEVVERWYTEDIFWQINPRAENLKQLKGIYFDAGIMDELGMNQVLDPIAAMLTANGVSYVTGDFTGGHFSNSFERLAISLAFCSDALK